MVDDTRREANICWSTGVVLPVLVNGQYNMLANRAALILGNYILEDAVTLIRNLL